MLYKNDIIVLMCQIVLLRIQTYGFRIVQCSSFRSCGTNLQRARLQIQDAFFLVSVGGSFDSTCVSTCFVNMLGFKCLCSHVFFNNYVLIIPYLCAWFCLMTLCSVYLEGTHARMP